jgi:putative endonuclease
MAPPPLFKHINCGEVDDINLQLFRQNRQADRVATASQPRQDNKNRDEGVLFMGWCVYIVECNDASLYTGITTDLTSRLAKHNNGTGAKYTAARRPVTLRYHEVATNRSDASQREATIKKMTRAAKLALCQRQGQKHA